MLINYNTQRHGPGTYILVLNTRAKKGKETENEAQPHQEPSFGFALVFFSLGNGKERDPQTIRRGKVGYSRKRV